MGGERIHQADFEKQVVCALELYEPSLALRALKLAWQGLNGQPEQEYKSRANDVLCRIARMDMAEALLMKISKGEDIWLRTRQ